MLLAPALMFLGTAVHEGTHAAAVLLAGGTVDDLVLVPTQLPTGWVFGYVSYADAPEGPLVPLAPAVVSTLVALVTSLLLARARPTVPARVALLFGVVLPLVDVSMSAAALFAGHPAADWTQALAGREQVVALVLIPYFAAFSVLAWRAFRAACADALRAPEFAAGLWTLLALPWLRFVGR